MIYECDECCAALPADVTACPRCGEAFDEPVPPDATLPRRGFSAAGSPPTIILGNPLTAAAPSPGGGGRHAPEYADARYAGGQSADARPAPPRGAAFHFSPAPAPAAVVFFQSADVSITLTHAALGGRTYAMANVASVSMARVPPDRSAAYALAVLGVILLGVAAYVASAPAALAGAALLALTGVVAARQKAQYLVRIGTDSAKLNVLCSRDSAYVRKIVDAISQAITMRG